MWKPPVNFLTLHYTWIIFMGLLSLAIIYPYGNLAAVDAYFFGASASTESGLNTVDVKELKTYQQVYIYLIPIFTNIGFINILVVVFRLRWFEKHLKKVGLRLTRTLLGYIAPKYMRPEPPAEDNAEAPKVDTTRALGEAKSVASDALETSSSIASADAIESNVEVPEVTPARPSAIQFAENSHPSAANKDKALYIPPPWRRDRGFSFSEVDERYGSEDEDEKDGNQRGLERQKSTRSIASRSRSRTVERAVSSIFVLGNAPTQGSSRPAPSEKKPLDLPNISSQATIGRNSQFYNLTAEDKARLGGIEYRSLKLLLRIVTGYFFGLHLFGAICLVGWILHCDPKYREYLAQCGQGNVWWAFYSAQSMVDNLGFTLTPDSMVTFRDATFPMILMSFLAFAGNTCYPCLLRLIIWITFKLCPEKSSMKEPLSFLLDHPRRCYTLLFPSRPTWILFGILLAMNSIDVILIIVLDLHNPAVSDLAPGPRVLAAIFQAANARHTGGATFNLADVNPAVQFSLLVMMYIAIFPIAISIRASNVYEENSLGIYESSSDPDESNGKSYIMKHIQNQLSFDLWYIFLGVFCISIAESGRIADNSIPAYSIFSILFEVTSAYANVGLSLGYPTVNTSLSGTFSVFSKLVICFMMIRGRHRGLPYKLDRAVVLPSEREDEAYQTRGRSQDYFD
ncbi:Low-affinity potassium transport protein [Penicillium diatomitis]|uniref:Low-affinity potassium transport protein n=1 Tax=Penicillium diatomitis TaxID=2819901 RepID=A0A9W9X6Z5_9EURO|nr:Low-affinity potassium transport protein [Penicillium diatomitis]KAJ5484825.1 Low-affinity potassium transport protein [Penicillium diatomitis]